MLEHWCRSCFCAAPDAHSCASCGSTDVLSHKDAAKLGIAHIDCDAFYAAVEKRDDPSLAAIPLIIGGNGRRGVVSTACYLARAFGVHSAMPIYQAKRKCPVAKILSPNMAKYVAEGERLRELMRTLTPLVEPVSIDEAFLDLTGTERVHHGPPVQTLLRLQQRIRQQMGITVSIGLSYNKFLAKIASDLDKPSGFSMIGEAETLTFLAQKPVDFIFGVGPALSRKLAAQGLTKIAHIQNRPDADMAKHFGEQGLQLARLARGIDTRKVSPAQKRKSISSETTFNDDITDLQTLERHLWRQCERAARMAKAKKLAGGTAVLKLKDNVHQIITRQKPLNPPSDLADILFRTLQPSLQKLADGRAFRLIGAGFSSLCASQEGDQYHDLLDNEAPRRALAERAMDEARAKFGDTAIQKGRALDQSKKVKKPKSK